MPDTTPRIPRSITSVWPAVVLLVFACVVLVVAWGYPPVAARFPVMVAVAMIVLALLDVLSRTRLPGAGLIEIFGGTGFRRREMAHDPSFAEQAECVGWVAGCFMLMAALGILASSPIFCAAFVRLRGKRTLGVAILVGLIVLAFQYAVFEWALDYKLYRGLFVTRGGISAW
jgi:hypothetical protein